MGIMKILFLISAFILFPALTYAEMKYPYKASSTRTQLIKKNYKLVKVGDSELDVKHILSQPDEITKQYEAKIKNPKHVGKAYWYIIQRNASSGSVNDKGEILVKIVFNLKGKVTHIHHWGF